MSSNLETWLQKRFEEVTPMMFYRGIFPKGELDTKGSFTKGKYTGIIVSVKSEKKTNGKNKVYRYTLTDDLEAVDEVIKTDDFCLCSPLSYAGKRRTAENARLLYAVAVDVDKVRTELDEKGNPAGMRDLWHQVQNVKHIPRPTYIVSSGTGLHLYYVLDKPIPLYADVAREIQEYKRELTKKIWNEYIVNIKDSKEIQQEGIYQGFRMPGTVTKAGGRARAFLTGERVTLEYLNSFVDAGKAKKAIEAQKKKGTIKLSEAAERWPEWYQARIINGEKRGVWHVSRNLYEWWKAEIKKGATVGHRYYCLMMLAMYAQKCSYYDAKHNPNPVTREELEKDCFELMNHMESLTEKEDNHFETADVLDALEAFDDRWTTYPRSAVEYRSGINIPANKRNGQSQAAHLEEARAIRDIRAKRRGERWDAHNGRKTKQQIVAEWRKRNPNGIKADCIRETGLSKPTVYKHWDNMLITLDVATKKDYKKSDINDMANTTKFLYTSMKTEMKTLLDAAEGLKKIIEIMPEGEEKERSKAEYRKLIETVKKFETLF